jgi:hypothetical protein
MPQPLAYLPNLWMGLALYIYINLEKALKIGGGFKVDRLVFRYCEGIYGQKYFCLDFSTTAVTIEF